MVKKIWVSCPLCCWSTMLDAKGRLEKGKEERKSFDKFSLDNSFFLQMRNITGGRGHGGFWTIPEESLTIKQASSIPEYIDLIEQIDDFCKNWLKFRKLKS